MIETKTQTDSFDAAMTRVEARDSNAGPSWLHPLRRHALARFKQLGWPTTKNEAWRFTNLQSLAKQSFQLAQDEPTLTQKDLTPFVTETKLSGLLVFENGFYRPELSSTEQLPQGVTLGSLTEAFQSSDQVLQDHLTRYAPYEEDAVTALNTAFMEQGAFLRVEPGTSVEHPIQILFIQTGNAETQAVCPRNLVLAGANSQVVLLESYFAVGGGSYFTNRVMEIALEEGARVSHSWQECESEDAFHLSSCQVHQARNSHYDGHQVLLGGKLVRNNVRVCLDGPGAEAVVNGLFVGHGTQHMDNAVDVDHAKPHCNSTQFFKGMMDDRARGVFSGAITVREDAQKTDAKQSNRNLLLSPNARIDTKPQLEIYADDVKCAHGATTGQLDEDALFYIQTRGINPQSARDLLRYAFAHEVIERMPLACVRAHAEAFLYQRFSKAKLLGEG